MPRGAKPKIYPADLVARVATLYRDGATQAEIAALEGISQRVIWRLMQRHSIAARPAVKRDQFGPNNPQWRGDDAGKQALHRRLYIRFGKPVRCTVCETTSAEHYDYANLSGHYEDLNDYAAMCRSCHWRYDDKIQNIRRSVEQSNA